MEKEKEIIKQEPILEKEYYTKKELDDITNKIKDEFNSKIAELFGDVIKNINKEPEPKQEQKEEKIEDFLF